MPGSKCSFPIFTFAFPIPIAIPSLPAIPSFDFLFDFLPPCPLD